MPRPFFKRTGRHGNRRYGPIITGVGASIRQSKNQKVSTKQAAKWFLKTFFAIVLLSIVASFLVFLWYNSSSRRTPLHKLPSLFLRHAANYIDSVKNVAIPDNNVGSKKCIIQSSPIFPAYFKASWSKDATPHCRYHKKVANLVNDSKLVLTKEFRDSDCCFQNILRGTKDSEYSLSPCKTIKNGETTIDKKMETFLVKCDGKNQSTFDARIPMKAIVTKKMKHWQPIPVNERPWSVLLFGFDTTSRANAYRNLPKTIPLMKKLGFHDFTSYQSMAPSTLTNFMGFLMGKPRNFVRKTCSKTWTSFFDSCPFIWKLFDEAGYITTYIEDSDQSFNWGGQAGFKNEPTDYYIHHFFRALKSTRDEQWAQISNLKGKKSKPGKPPDKNFHLCTSSEKIPQWQLKYTQKIMEKFARNQTPTFTFLWFADPVHDNLRALGNMDASLFKFFSDLQTQKILDRTLTIFLSDHGDRTTTFSTKSVISFLERGNPKLFIKLPKNPAKNDDDEDDLTKILKKNSKILITPYDIHHTLLHVLSDQRPGFLPGDLNHQTKLFDGSKKSSGNYNKWEYFSSKNFSPILKNRSSLLVPLNESRDCQQLKISPANCLCNLKYDEYSEGSELDNEGKLDVKKCLQFAVMQMNSIVQKSKYKNVCEKISVRKIGKTVRVSETDEYRDYLITFETFSQSRGEFQVRVRAFLAGRTEDKESAPMKAGKETGMMKMELISYARTNLYSSQSWCVGQVTDFDKEVMKPLCYCKGKARV